VDQEALPISVVAPLTESSAEYQAIAYALTHPETRLVFVDRPVDYVFQWQPTPAPGEAETEEEQEAAQLHGKSIGVTVGSLEPTFDAFLHYLLQNSNTRHFTEWWEQYVERTILHADYQTYRQVMTLVGSLIHQLGRRPEDLVVDRLRERFMWTRIKQDLTEHAIAPEDALYICGAAHLASDAPEFGTRSAERWDDMPERSQTQWLFGLIPSSFAAIEQQFSHPAGTIALAESTWRKSLKAAQLRPFQAAREEKPSSARKNGAPPPESPPEAAATDASLADFLGAPPDIAAADHDQLLDWCARIVGLARENGYLGSTADSIAIYETTYLLAGIRNRRQPSPYDFQDAAITCLEKDRTPKKRTIAQLCRILLGGDRVGTVGYESLPPLARNIYDRLEPLKVNLYAKTNQRALLDFTQRPDLRDCSELLWRLNYLLGDAVVQPIIGERTLGGTPLQESWEIRLGKYQRDVIQLGYEGVTLEQVLEQRMRQRAFGEDATAAGALHTAEASLMYLSSPRFTEELGFHSRALLIQETGVKDAPDIFDRARRLVHHYRTTPHGLAAWLESFVATGYSHYASLLPRAMADRGTTPEEVAGMLGFIFSLESLALSVGCQRSELVISVEQAGREEAAPDKLGLLWVAEWLLNRRTVAEMREFFTHLTEDPLSLHALPAYLNGFILALRFAPRIALFVVELLSHVFRAVPDSLLIPWLPGFILQLRRNAAVLEPLIKEAALVFPASLQELKTWQPRWMQDARRSEPGAPAAAAAPTPEDEAIRELLAAHPAAPAALAALLGIGQAELVAD
ncbi:MAG TPA: DUF5682 family protein, partial [Herpetosiphonaceae bacterium]|nr:DUF5682 family protein [Herpetosiphonaceae bacterium]